MRYMFKCNLDEFNRGRYLDYWFEYVLGVMLVAFCFMNYYFTSKLIYLCYGLSFMSIMVVVRPSKVRMDKAAFWVITGSRLYLYRRYDSIFINLGCIERASCSDGSSVVLKLKYIRCRGFKVDNKMFITLRGVTNANDFASLINSIV